MELAEERGRAMTESGDLVLSMGTRSLTFRAWSTEADLRSFVRLVPDPSYIGEDVEEPTRYYSLAVASPLAASDAVDGLLAIVCDRYSIAPTVMPIDSDLLFIACNRALSAYDVRSSSIVSSEAFDTPVKALISLVDLDVILVETELGVHSIDRAGSIRWSFEEDILEQLTLDGGTLVLTFEGGVRRLDARSGISA